MIGLPDFTPVQQALSEALRERLSESIAAMEPEALLKAWLPAGVKGLEQFQKMFWSQGVGDDTTSGGKK